MSYELMSCELVGCELMYGSGGFWAGVEAFFLGQTGKMQ
jgi:hypothetical protein